MAGPLNLVFNVLADSSQAESQMKSLQDAFRDPLGALKTQLSEAASESKNLGGAFEVFTASTVGLATTLGAVAAAAVAVGAAFAKSTSAVIELGSSLNDLSAITGLSVENLSALRVAAAEGGSSLDQIGSAFVRFQRAAVEGSAEAKSALAFFGLTSKEVTENSSAAFDKFLQTFNELGPSAERTAAGIQLFGRDFARLIPTLEALSGGFTGARKDADRLGVTMTTELAKAADRVGDAMARLKLIAEGLALSAGKTLLPALESLLKLFKELEPVIPIVSLQIQGLTRALIPGLWVLEKVAEVLDVIVRTRRALGAMPEPPGMGKTLDAEAAKRAAAAGEQLLKVQEEIRQGQIAASYVKPPKAKKAGKSEAEKEAEALAERVKAATKSYQELVAAVRDDVLRNKFRELETSYGEFVTAFKDSTKDLLSEMEKAMAKADQLFRYAAVLRERVRELQAQPTGAGAIAPGAAIPGVEPIEIPPIIGPSVESENKAALDRIALQFQVFSNVLQTALEPVAQAAQASFEAFILMGQAGSIAFKKLAAQIIAALAIQSAVQAIYELAQGFASLAMAFFNPAYAAKATLHFEAAALYGMVAGGALVTGAIIGAAGGLGGQGAGAGGEFGGETTPGDVYIGGGGAASIGRRREDLLIETLEANTAVMNRLGSAPAGEVAVWMGEQAPVVFTQAAAEGAARDSGAGRRLMANAGVGN